MGFLSRLFSRSEKLQSPTVQACFYHPKKKVVAQCSSCEQNICSNCIGRESQSKNSSKILCKACLNMKEALQEAGVPTTAATISEAVLGYNLLGGLAQGAKMAEKAIEYYEMGVKLAKAHNDEEMTARCLNGIGQVYVSLKKPKKAIGYHQECMKIAPNFGIGHEALVVAYWASGRIKDAKKEMRKLIATEYPVNQALKTELEKL